MPLFTPNRGYPYSVPGDPADVPAALQALAEAVNDDVQALQDLVGPRPMARVRGTTQVVTGGAAVTFNDLPFELTDFNIGGAVAPITNGTLTINLPGLWFMVGTLVYPSPLPAANIDYVGVKIMDTAANAEIAENSVHSNPALAELQRQMDVGGSAYIPPGSEPYTFNLRGEVGRSAGTAQYALRERTLTVIRMTES